MPHPFILKTIDTFSIVFNWFVNQKLNYIPKKKKKKNQDIQKPLIEPHFSGSKYNLPEKKNFN